MSNDLIRRSDALEALEKIFKRFAMAWNPNEPDNNGSSATAVPNAIMNLPAYDADKAEPGWIPVEKGLPDTEDYILLSFSNFTLPLVGRYEEDKDGRGAFYIGDCDEQDTCISNDLFVNAWMLLPEPYRPEEERNDTHICTNCRNRGMSKANPGKYACWKNPAKEVPLYSGNIGCVNRAEVPHGMRMEKEMGR